MAEPDMRVAESRTPRNAAAAAARRIDAALPPHCRRMTPPLRNVRRRRAADAISLRNVRQSLP